MKKYSQSNKLWLIVGVCSIAVGFCGWLIFSVYLMSYEDIGIPQDVPLWTVVDMTKFEWLIYILGAYVTTAFIIAGTAICIWQIFKIYRNHRNQ